MTLKRYGTWLMGLICTKGNPVPPPWSQLHNPLSQLNCWLCTFGGNLMQNCCLSTWGKLRHSSLVLTTQFTSTVELLTMYFGEIWCRTADYLLWETGPPPLSWLHNLLTQWNLCMADPSSDTISESRPVFWKITPPMGPIFSVYGVKL